MFRRATRREAVQFFSAKNDSEHVRCQVLYVFDFSQARFLANAAGFLGLGWFIHLLRIVKKNQETRLGVSWLAAKVAGSDFVYSAES